MLLFLIIRPIAVLISLYKSRIALPQMFMVSFFGIRGIGSLYYLGYAITHGLPEQLANTLGDIVLLTVSFSLLVHSNTASIVLRMYKSYVKR